jgi:hypothetical protein
MMQLNGLGLIPSWQFSQDPVQNPNLTPYMQMPPGMYQTTLQPVGPYMTGMGGLGDGMSFGEMSTAEILFGILSTASAAISGYHGYKRNDSLGWGLAWFALGGLFPVLTPTIAFAEGYAKPKR